jgi:hypothetical protein
VLYHQLLSQFYGTGSEPGATVLFGDFHNVEIFVLTQLEISYWQLVE